MEDFIKLIADAPEIRNFTIDNSCYYSWRRKGISLRFVSGRLSAAFLYADAADGFSQYRGELPAALSFNDKRRNVESKLGAPEQQGGEMAIPYWAEYKSKGVFVGYQSNDDMDPNGEAEAKVIALRLGKEIVRDC